METEEFLLVPHSREAEQRVLGALMIDNNSIDRMGELPEAAFFTEAHRLIYRAIRKQSAAGKTWDVITVAEMLDAAKRLDQAGGMAYIGEIVISTASSANIGRYAEIVRDHYIRRQIMVAANELTALVASKGDIDSALDRAQASLMVITQNTGNHDPRSMAEILPEHFERIERRQETGPRAIPTGLDNLDSILNGGWHRGQLIVLAARPSMGKTAMAMLNAYHAARTGHGVLYLSMEMVAEELSDRLLSSVAKIDFSTLLTGKVGEEEWGRLSEAHGVIAEIPLYIEDKSGLNFYQVATMARRHKRKHGLDLLVLDYLQLMAGTDDDDKRHSQIEEITRGLKNLAKELNCAAIVLSQLNRKTEQTRRPQLSHLRDSGSVEQDADVVIFIHREEVDNPDTSWKNYADIYIGKQRNGPLGRVGATYYGHQVRFQTYTGILPDWSAKTLHKGDDL